MESQNSPSDVRARAASLLNEALASRVARGKRLRLAIAILLAGTGIGAILIQAISVFSVPCLIGAFIAYLLYLDARDQLREVKSRNWSCATPRISTLGNLHRSSTPDAPTYH